MEKKINFKIYKDTVFHWYNDWVKENVTYDIQKPVKNKDYEQFIYVAQKAAEFGYEQCLKQIAIENK